MPAPTLCVGLTPASLEYILVDVFYKTADGPMRKALKNEGVESFADLLGLTEEDIKELKYKDDQGNAVVLNKIECSYLIAYRAYRWYRREIVGDPITIENCNEVDPKAFHDYRASSNFATYRLQQQDLQQRDEDDSILGRGVYEKLTGAVCFFLDEEDKPIGVGFAVSGTTVYSVAHHFPESAVGTRMSCHFGKPNQHLVRQLEISSVDRRLDYCILRTVSGESPLPTFLELSREPLRPGRNCILAAFQIGIQDDLNYLDPDLSVGVFKGEISKLYPRHFVYQCASFAGDSGGAVVLKNGRVIGIHQETVIQARERIQREGLDNDARLESVEASIDELLRSLSSGSIGLQLSAIPEPESPFKESSNTPS